MNNNDKYLDFLESYTAKENKKTTPQPKLPKKEVKKENSFVPKAKKRIEQPKDISISKYESNSYNYEDVVIEDLPLGEFYPSGVKIKFRECRAKEIQSYSTLDEKNIFDFKAKLNEIIEECVVYINQDGSYGSYRQIFENDRI